MMLPGRPILGMAVPAMMDDGIEVFRLELHAATALAGLDCAISASHPAGSLGSSGLPAHSGRHGALRVPGSTAPTK